MGDIEIIMGIATLFIVLGAILPFIHAEYNIDDEVSTTDIESVLEVNAEHDTGILTVFKVFASMISMFFWSFGQLPIWIDTLFLLIRITFFITLARQFTGSGG
jgi:uncharacterized membrane protein